jgi:hypothetical protein
MAFIAMHLSSFDKRLLRPGYLLVAGGFPIPGRHGSLLEPLGTGNVVPGLAANRILSHQLSATLFRAVVGSNLSLYRKITDRLRALRTGPLNAKEVSSEAHWLFR